MKFIDIFGISVFWKFTIGRLFAFLWKEQNKQYKPLSSKLHICNGTKNEGHSVQANLSR